MTTFDVQPDIMEVTLRDGSYVIDFQFTAEDTATLVAALEGVGFRWIEIGHGLGLNARDVGTRRAVATDEEHLSAAAAMIKTARWGTFFIPGIGREEDLRLAARYGMSFVRIGTNITQADRARPFVDLAKELGMIVCYNAMKSYAVSPHEFAGVARQAQTWGADIVYLVDSAGTMLPQDVRAFFTAIQAETDVPIGFHGHDNLSMGTANTLQAIESGAALVDSSLRGMGRSAGNVITEALLAILQRRGIFRDIDLKGVMDVSEGLIQPLVPGRGLDTMAITAGLSGFHSGFTDKVKAYAQQFDIDVRDLIVRLCEEDRINAPDEVLERLSAELAQARTTHVISIPAFGAAQPGQQASTGIEDLIQRLYAEAVKTSTYTVLNLFMSDVLLAGHQRSPHVHRTPQHIIGSVAISDPAALREVLAAADGNVDIIALDVDRKAYAPHFEAASLARSLVSQSLLLTYSFARLHAEAVRDQIARLLDDDLSGAHIVIAGDHHRSRRLALALAELHARPTLLAGDGAETDIMAELPGLATLPVDSSAAQTALQFARVVVGWQRDSLDASAVAVVPDQVHLLDAAIGSFTAEALSDARARHILPLRVNIWPTFSGFLLGAHASAQVRHSALGAQVIAGVPVVAGGVIGEPGAVIVDDVHHPARIIGVADGRGGLRTQYSPQEAEHVRALQTWINEQRIRPTV